MPSPTPHARLPVTSGLARQNPARPEPKLSDRELS
jgi:hypothetical protein